MSRQESSRAVAAAPWEKPRMPSGLADREEVIRARPVREGIAHVRLAD